MASGNTFGARYWTDGWRDAPMMPESPWLVICPHCAKPVWLDELEKVGESEPWGNSDEDFPGAASYRVLTVQDYLACLDSADELEAEKLRYVRVQAWWRGNDVRRDTEDPAPLSVKESANLGELAKLLASSDGNDQIMKAEVLRELGQFEQAGEVLAGPFDDQLEAAVSFIADLAAKKNSIVAELKF